MTRHGLPAALALALLASVLASAQEATPDYDADVAPILKKYCAGCHNDDDREGDFSLESYASLGEGVDGSSVVQPGRPDDSRLLLLMIGAAKPIMPPKGKPRPDDREIDAIRTWIAAGAKGPKGNPSDRLTLNVPAVASRTATRPITALEASPDGRWLAIGRYGRVELHAVAVDGRDEASHTFGPLPGKVTAVHFSADGKRLAAASGVAGLGGVATLWDLDGGEILREFRGHRDLLHDAELSPDGAVLATCSYDAKVILWDVATGEPLRTLDGHNGAVYDVAFSRDGRYLLSGSADDTCKLWRVADGLRLDTLAQPLKEVSACFFGPDDLLLACGADANIRGWKFVSREKPDINPMPLARFAHEGPIIRAALSADGGLLATVGADCTIKLWDLPACRERTAWPEQPDVGSALAFSADGRTLHVGRLDGSLNSLAIPSPKAEERMVRTDAVTVATTATGEVSQVVEREPNDSPGQAQAVTLPAEIAGTIDGKAGDFDLYRFEARAGQEWVIEVDAARSKSPLDSYIAVLDAEGRPVPRIALQAVRDSYFTFRGKDDAGVDDFRMFNWEEMDLDSYLYANGEVVKLWLYPRGPDSGFMVYPGQGRRWGCFDTTPLAHALGEPAYVVVPHPPGESLTPNGLPVFTLNFENDDDAKRVMGKDSKLTFTAPADGSYFFKIRDVRWMSGPEFKYKATIRPRRPDFRVTVSGADPVLAPGAVKEFKVHADRLDDFDGPITVELLDLPPGIVASSPIVIERGQVEAFGVLSVRNDATAPTEEQRKAGRIVATAMIGDREVVHETARPGALRWTDKQPIGLAILPVDDSPGPIATDDDGTAIYAIRPGETITLKVRVDRHGFAGQVPFGKEGAGRNLPFGVYVDNLGLSGLLILESQDERAFMVTADKDVPEQSRPFHLTTGVEGGQSSPPVRLRVVRPKS